MPETASHDITQLLHGWSLGNREAFEKLMPLAYPQLKRVAGSFLRRERPGHTLQATALVHELYLVLLRQRQVELKDRHHFFTFAARLMRFILRDWARDHRAEKRGGGAIHVPLSEDLPWLNANGEGILDLETALGELEQLDARKAQLVELRHYLGCTAEEAADVLGISKATVDRELRMVKAWLYQRLRGAPPGNNPDQPPHHAPAGA